MKITNQIIVTITLIGALLMHGAAIAAETGPYVGAFVSRSTRQLTVERLDQSTLRDDLIDFESSLENRNNDVVLNPHFGLTVGWQCVRWLGIEVSFMPLADIAYHFDGEIAGTGTRRLRSGNAVHSMDVYSLSALASLPITNRLSVGGRVGLAQARTKVQLLGSERDYGVLNSGVGIDERYSATDSVPLFGVNAEFALASFLTLRLDWQHFPTIGKVGPTPESVGFPNFKLDAYTFSGIWRF